MRKKFEKNEEETKISLEEKMKLQDETEGDIFQKVLDRDFVERELQIDEELFADKEFEDYIPTKEQVRTAYQKVQHRYEKLQRERMREKKREEFPEEFSEEIVPDERLVHEVGQKKEKTVEAAGSGHRTESIRERRVISLDDERKRRKKDVEEKYARSGYRENTGGEPGSRKVHRFGKVVGMALVCVACVFAASMTSEANRKYLVNSVRIWSGDDSKTVVYNDESNEDANPDEDRAIADIEEKLGVEVPVLVYRPYDLKFSNYMIDDLTSLARIEYKYKNDSILFIIDKQNTETASKINSLDGDEKESIVIENEGTLVTIKKIYNKDGTFNYSAEWYRGETAYLLSGKIELEEIKKIVEKMKF